MGQENRGRAARHLAGDRLCQEREGSDDTRPIKDTGMQLTHTIGISIIAKAD